MAGLKNNIKKIIKLLQKNRKSLIPAAFLFVFLCLSPLNSSLQAISVGLTSISPTYGSTSGGNSVTIYGSGFSDIDCFSTSSTSCNGVLSWNTYYPSSTPASTFPARTGGRAFISGNYIYYLGGKDGSGNTTDTFYKAPIFSPINGWAQISGVTLPASLSDFALVKNGNYLYIYGGISGSSGSYSGNTNIYQIDISHLQDTIPNISSSNIGTGPSSGNVLGLSPVVYGNYIYLFGGASASGSPATPGSNFYYTTLSNPGSITLANSTTGGYNFPSSYGIPVVRVGNYLWSFGAYSGSPNRNIYYSQISGSGTSGISNWSNLKYSNNSNIQMPQTLISTTYYDYVSSTFSVIGETVYGFGGTASNGTKTNYIESASISSLLNAIASPPSTTTSIWTASSPSGSMNSSSGAQALIVNSGTSSQLWLIGGDTSSSSTNYYLNKALVNYNRGNKYNPDWTTNWRTDQTGLTLGGSTATGLTYNSSNQMTATTPAHSAGLVDVVYTAADGTTASLTSQSSKYDYYSGTAGYSDDPTSLQATAGYQQVALNWTAPTYPTNTGNLSIRYYVVRYKPVGGNYTFWGSTTDTSATVTGLTNGQQYIFEVNTINSYGSDASYASVSGTPANTPGTPTITSATTGDGTITSYWNQPSDNGATITNYKYRYSTESTCDFNGTISCYTEGSFGSNSTSGQISGLTNGSTYYFAVAAVNSIGTGSYSSSSSATPSTVPNPPTILTSSTGNAEITFTWQTPSSNGGSSITGYLARYSDDSNCDLTSSTATCYSSISVTTNPVTITENLINNHTYTIGLFAINQNGQSPSSNLVTAQPLNPPVINHFKKVFTKYGSNSYAIRSDNTVWAWGSNDYGELGNGTTNNSVNPVQVLGPNGVGYLENIVDISTFNYSVLALDSNGRVYYWGGPLDNNNNATSAPILISHFTSGSQDVNYNVGPNGQEITFKSISAIDSVGYGVSTGGNIYLLNYSQNYGSIIQLQSIGNIKSVSASGYGHILALDNDGYLWSTGSEVYNHGELGHPCTYDQAGNCQFQKVQTDSSGNNFLSNIINFQASYYSSFALDSSGKLYSWGSNGTNALGYYATSNQEYPQQVYFYNGQNEASIQEFSLDSAYGFARDTNNNVYYWGSSNYAQYGNGYQYYLSPSLAQHLYGYSGITAGYDHVLAISSNGTIHAWGHNDVGQTGIDNNFNDVYYPTKVTHQPLPVDPEGGTISGDTEISINAFNLIRNVDQNNNFDPSNSTKVYLIPHGSSDNDYQNNLQNYLITDYQATVTAINTSTGVITATTKQQDMSAVDLLIINPDNQYDYLKSAYNYYSAPSQVTSVSAYPAGAPRTIQVYWERPINNGGAPTIDYIIRYAKSSDNCDLSDNNATCYQSYSYSEVNFNTYSSYSININGLSNNVEYQFAVLGHNQIGIGQISSSVSATPYISYNWPTVYYPNENIGFRGVQLTGENNTYINNTTALPSGDCSSPCTYYQIFNDTPYAQLYQGGSYNLNLTSTAIENNGQPIQALAFIDWNDDGYFSTDPTQSEIMPYSTANGMFTPFIVNPTRAIPIQVPVNATPGYHRLRIGAEALSHTNWGDFTSGFEGNYFGAYEDYTIQVIVSPLSSPLNFTTTSSGNNGYTQVQWSIPTYNGGSAVKNYYIQYARSSDTYCDINNYHNAAYWENSPANCSGGAGQYGQIFLSEPTAPYVTNIQNLTNGTEYKFAIFAENANGDFSPAYTNPITDKPLFPAATITSISPNQATNTGSQEITLTLSNFQSDTSATQPSVKLYQSSTNSENCSITSLNTDLNANPPTTTIVCDVDLTDVLIGNRIIVVSNFDSHETISSSPQVFNVTAGPLVLTSANPPGGSVDGGTLVTISGKNFVSAYQEIEYTITNNGPALQNTQVGLEFDGVSLGQNNEIRSDCGDVRTFDQNHQPLSYIITECHTSYDPSNPNRTSGAYVKIPNLPEGQTIVYLQFGNSNNTTTTGDIYNVLNGTIEGLKAAFEYNNCNYNQATNSYITSDQSGNNLTGETSASSGCNSEGGPHDNEIAKGAEMSSANNIETVIHGATGLNLTDQLTLETWFKPTSFSQSNLYPTLIARASCDTGVYGYNLSFGNNYINQSSIFPLGKNRLILFLYGGDTIRYIVSNNNINNLLGQWHHVVATYRNYLDPVTSEPKGEGRIYLDGVDITDYNAPSSTILNVPAELNMPYAYNGNVPNAIQSIDNQYIPDTYFGKGQCAGDHFDGFMDSVRIYDHAISQQEVNQLYNDTAITLDFMQAIGFVNFFNNPNSSITHTEPQKKGLAVNFGTTASTDVNYVSQNQITALSPAHAEGTVDLKVINGNQAEQTLTGAFTYLDYRLKITSINNGNPVHINEPFSIKGTIVDSQNNPLSDVSIFQNQNYQFTLSLNSGTGTFTSTPFSLSNTSSFFDAAIPGANPPHEFEISGLKYNKIEDNISLTIADTTNDNTHLKLASSNSDQFNVVTGDPATQANSSIKYDTEKTSALADNKDNFFFIVHLATSSNVPAHDKTVQAFSNEITTPANLRNITPFSCLTVYNQIGAEYLSARLGDAAPAYLPTESEYSYSPNVTDQFGNACYSLTSSYYGSGSLHIADLSDFDYTEESTPTDLNLSFSYNFTGPAAGSSTLISQAQSALANGGMAINFAATLLDSNNHPFPGRQITLERTNLADPGSATVTPIICPGSSGEAGITDDFGQACFSVTSTDNGNYKFIASLNRPVTTSAVETNYSEIFQFPASPIEVHFGSGKIWGNNGRIVANAANDFSNYKMLAEGALVRTSDGKYIQAHQEVNFKTGAKDIYIQKIDTNGDTLWGTDSKGILVYSNQDTQNNTVNLEVYQELKLTADESGGAIITWVNQIAWGEFNGTSRLDAEHFASDGSRLWSSGDNFNITSNLYRVDETIPAAPSYTITKDGSGGVYLAYRNLSTSIQDSEHYNLNINHLSSTSPSTSSTGWPHIFQDCSNALNASLAYDSNTESLLIAHQVNTSSCLANTNSYQRDLYQSGTPGKIQVDSLESTGTSTDQFGVFNSVKTYDNQDFTNDNSGCSTDENLEQSNPLLLSDNNSGAFLLYTEKCNGNLNNYAAHLGLPGETPTLAKSFHIGNGDSIENNHSIPFYQGFVDNGLLFVGSNDTVNPSNLQRYSVSVSDSGNGYNISQLVPAWDGDYNTTGNQPIQIPLFKILSNGNGGVNVLWFGQPLNATSTPLNQTLWAIQINQSGQIASDPNNANTWPSNGVQISNTKLHYSNTDLSNSLLSLDDPNELDTGARNEKGELEKDLLTFENYAYDYQNIAVPDGQGGFVANWSHFNVPLYQNVDLDLYLQNISANGEKLWNNGASLEIDPDTNTNIIEQNQSAAQVVQVNDYHSVYVWLDTFNAAGQNSPTLQIRGESFDRDGNAQWQKQQIDGRSFGIALSERYNSSNAISDLILKAELNSEFNPTGNTFLAYHEYPNIIKLIKLNQSGQIIFQQSINSIDNIPVNNVYLNSLDIISDHQGGVHLVWIDDAPAYKSVIRHAHFDQNGNNNITNENLTLYESPFESENSVNNVHLSKLKLDEFNDQYSTLQYLVSWQTNTATPGINNGLQVNVLKGSTEQFDSNNPSYLSPSLNDYNIDDNKDQLDHKLSVDRANHLFFVVYTDRNPDNGEIRVMAQKVDMYAPGPFWQPLSNNDINLDVSSRTGYGLNQNGTYSSGTTISNLQIIPAGDGGAIISWMISNAQGNHLIVSRIASDNSFNWEVIHPDSSGNIGLINPVAANYHSGNLLFLNPNDSANNNTLYLQNYINGIGRFNQNSDASSLLALNNSELSGHSTPINTILQDDTDGGIFSWYFQPQSLSTTDIYAQNYLENTSAFDSTLTTDKNSAPADLTNPENEITVTATLLDGLNQPRNNVKMSLRQVASKQGYLNIKACDSEWNASLNYAHDTFAYTNNNGQACWKVRGTQTGKYLLAAFTSTANTAILESVATVTLTERPVDADLSTITLTPERAVNDNSSPLNIIVSLKNALGEATLERTAELSSNGTNITFTAINCTTVKNYPAAPTTVTNGTSNSYGDICYKATSSDIQTAQLTVTAQPDNITLNSHPNLTFVAPTANPNLSTFTSDSHLVSGAHKGYANATEAAKYYSPYQSALLRITLIDNRSVPQLLSDATVTVNYAGENGNPNVLFSQVDCLNPRSVILNQDNQTSNVGTTGSNGEACFVATVDDQEKFGGNIQYSATITKGNNEPVNLNGPTVYYTSISQAEVLHYQFRHDDNTEALASSIQEIDRPSFNASSTDNFRLRFAVSRKLPPSNQENSGIEQFDLNKDTFDKKHEIAVDSVARNNYSSTLDNSFTIDENNNKAYLLERRGNPTHTANGGIIRLHRFNTNENSITSDGYFDLTGINFDESLPTDQDYNSSVFMLKSRIDPSSHYLYFGMITHDNQYPYNFILYKVDLSGATPTLAGSLPLPNRFVFQTEFDFENNFVYLVEQRVGDQPNPPQGAKLIKVRLNDLSVVGESLFIKNSELTQAQTLGIENTLIDTNNRYLYLIGSGKIFRFDLNVSEYLMPVLVSTTNLDLSSLKNVPQTIDLNRQFFTAINSAIIDPANNYIYLPAMFHLKSSTCTSSTVCQDDLNLILKINTDPNLQPQIENFLQTSTGTSSPSDNVITENTLRGAEFFIDPTAKDAVISTGGAIDINNQYAYFSAVRVIFTGPSIENAIFIPKMYRIDLKDFSHDTTYDELDLGPNMNIKAVAYSNSMGRVYFLHGNGKTTGNQDILDSAGGVNRLNLGLLAAKIVVNNGGPDLQIGPIDQSPYLELTSSNYFTEGAPTTNQLGHNNQNFVPGSIHQSSGNISNLKLGRNDSSEFEFNLKFKPEANGQYIFALKENYPGISESDGVTTTIVNQAEESFALATVGGINISKTFLNIIEGTTQDSYQVSLSYEPSADVNICLYENSNDLLKISVPSTGNSSTGICPDQTANGLKLVAKTLTFHSGQNWSDPQTVTVSSINNNTIDGTRTYQINPPNGFETMLGYINSEDPSYNHMLMWPVNVNVTDYGATTANVKVTISGGTTTFTPPDDFSFPAISLGAEAAQHGNYSPALPLSIDGIGSAGGQNNNFAITLHASPFCLAGSATMCIPLDKIYLGTSSLNNNDQAVGNFSISEIKQFMARYLSNTDTTTDSAYKDSQQENPVVLGASANTGNTITLFDTANMPNFSQLGNQLIGKIDFLLRLMIDYSQISGLARGDYYTTLTFDFIKR